MSLFDSGECEALKCSVHASLGLFGLLCLGYNAIAYVRRGQAHLGVNTVVYAALVAYEVAKTRTHCGDVT